MTREESELNNSDESNDPSDDIKIRYVNKNKHQNVPHSVQAMMKSVVRELNTKFGNSTEQINELESEAESEGSELEYEPNYTEEISSDFINNNECSQNNIENYLTNESSLRNLADDPITSGRSLLTTELAEFQYFNNDYNHLNDFFFMKIDDDDSSTKSSLNEIEQGLTNNQLRKSTKALDTYPIRLELATNDYLKNETEFEVVDSDLSSETEFEIRKENSDSSPDIVHRNRYFKEEEYTNSESVEENYSDEDIAGFYENTEMDTYVPIHPNKIYERSSAAWEAEKYLISSEYSVEVGPIMSIPRVEEIENSEASDTSEINRKYPAALKNTGPPSEQSSKKVAKEQLEISADLLNSDIEEAYEIQEEDYFDNNFEVSNCLTEVKKNEKVEISNFTTKPFPIKDEISSSCEMSVIHHSFSYEVKIVDDLFQSLNNEDCESYILSESSHVNSINCKPDYRDLVTSTKTDIFCSDNDSYNSPEEESPSFDEQIRPAARFANKTEEEVIYANIDCISHVIFNSENCSVASFGKEQSEPANSNYETSLTTTDDKHEVIPKKPNKSEDKFVFGNQNLKEEVSTEIERSHSDVRISNGSSSTSKMEVHSDELDPPILRTANDFKQNKAEVIDEKNCDEFRFSMLSDKNGSSNEAEWHEEKVEETNEIQNAPIITVQPTPSSLESAQPDRQYNYVPNEWVEGKETSHEKDKWKCLKRLFKCPWSKE